MPQFHSLTPKKCPPKDAISPNGIYYRIVHHDPPVSEDFCLWVLEPRYRHQLEEKTKGGDCGAFAISFFSEAGIPRMLGLFRGPIKRAAQTKNRTYLGVAEVKLDAATGLFKHTGNHHYNLWPFNNCKLETKVCTVNGI